MVDIIILSFQVVAVLWGLSVVGGWFHFLTLVYLCKYSANMFTIWYSFVESGLVIEAVQGTKELDVLFCRFCSRSHDSSYL